MNGRYELVEQPSGIRLTYSGRIVPDDDEISLIDLMAIRTNVARQFGALVREIERQTAAQRTGREQLEHDVGSDPRLPVDYQFVPERLCVAAS